MTVTTVGRVAALHRFPVKSMLGEELSSVELTERGTAGDRAFAVVDRADGKVATGKHPRKWSKLLELAASYVEDAGSPVAITFPDGTVVRSDAPGIDAALTTYLGRDVALVHGAAEGQVIEEVWPRIDGLAPEELVEAMSGGRREGDDPISDIPVSSLAPPGTFFDLTTLHVLTTATLRRLAELAPDSDFDVRRYRPNVLVEVEGSDFVENGWTGSTLRFGAGRGGARGPADDALRDDDPRPRRDGGRPRVAPGDRPAQPGRDPRHRHLGVRRVLRDGDGRRRRLGRRRRDAHRLTIAPS